MNVQRLPSSARGKQHVAVQTACGDIGRHVITAAFALMLVWRKLATDDISDVLSEVLLGSVSGG